VTSSKPFEVVVAALKLAGQNLYADQRQRFQERWGNVCVLLQAA
jgi:hypothetical protein